MNQEHFSAGLIALVIVVCTICLLRMYEKENCEQYFNWGLGCYNQETYNRINGIK